jgi:molybdenum cofactor synthesis domain-containing protein
MAKVSSVSISEKKGTKKKNVDFVKVVKDFGIKGDAHAGNGHRQVSFLAKESIAKMKDMGLNVSSGDFAENITTEGVDLCKLPIGTRIKVGDAVFVISQKGKICHHRCAIFFQAGDCIMPKEGIFGEVVSSGIIQPGDTMEVIEKEGLSVAIITLSDKGSKGERTDETGPALREYLEENFTTSFVRNVIIPDDEEKLSEHLNDFSGMQGYDLILTNGSTGVSPRDIAPDVTIKFIDKELPGFGEAMRMNSFQKTPHALISRAVSGFVKNSLVINLPGSPKGALENFQVIAPAIGHAVAKKQGDSSDCAQNVSQG